MLVLSRKVDQRIQIGEDITITVVRVEGNRVRIGIDAPRDQRIVRGELEPINENETLEFELSEREFAFAHQPEKAAAKKTTSVGESGNRRKVAGDQNQPSKNRPAKRASSGSTVVTGKVSADGSKVQLSTDDTKRARRSPLSSFVSAS